MGAIHVTLPGLPPPGFTHHDEKTHLWTAHVMFTDQYGFA